MTAIAPAPSSEKQQPSKNNNASRGGGGGGNKNFSSGGGGGGGGASSSSRNKSSNTSNHEDAGAAASDETKNLLQRDPVLQSIAYKQTVLLQPVVTLTMYVPTSCVGAVIGRKGQNIANLQKVSAQHGSCTNQPVRVSVVADQGGSGSGAAGTGGGSAASESIPYTYSELDWSNPAWTPVVIRADPTAALVAAAKLDAMCPVTDGVVLDVPLGRHRHYAIIGKRGSTLQNLSADTSVRIMVPNKDLRHDVVQLEGELPNVKQCLERVLQICSKPGGSTSTPPPPPPPPNLPSASSSSKSQPGGAKSSQNDPGASSGTVATVAVQQVPSQTKLRQVGRKTETSVKKKKADDGGWLLTVTGKNPEQVKQAVTMLKKWKEGENASADRQQGNNSNSNSNNNSNNANAGSSSSGPASGRRNNRGRSGGGGGRNKNNPNNSNKRGGKGGGNKSSGGGGAGSGGGEPAPSS